MTRRRRWVASNYIIIGIRLFSVVAFCASNLKRNLESYECSNEILIINSNFFQTSHNSIIYTSIHSYNTIIHLSRKVAYNWLSADPSMQLNFSILQYNGKKEYRLRYEINQKSSKSGLVQGLLRRQKT